MYKDENNISDQPEENEAGIDTQGTSNTSKVNKYIDRSGEIDENNSEFTEGAMWLGPSFEESDIDSEKERIRSIIQKNIPDRMEDDACTTDEFNEDDNSKKKTSFFKSDLFIIICCIVVPPLGIILACINKEFSKKKKLILIVIGAVMFAVFICSGIAIHKRQAEAREKSETEAVDSTLSSSEHSGPMFANNSEKSEDEIRAENFPKSNAHLTPKEFFTTKSTFSDFAYYYLYIDGTFMGYSDYNGTNIATIQTEYGNLMLLDSMFTFPEIESGEELFFYYLYIGFDQDFDCVFGIYVDNSIENEGSAETNVRAYEQGTYKVGEDIEAGEYLFYDTSPDIDAMVQLFGDDKYIERIASEEFKGAYFLTISDGQILVVNTARFALCETVRLPAEETINSSMYRVGIDIEAGKYHLTNNGSPDAAYIIYDGSDPLTRQVIESSSIENNTTVVVREGEYLQLIDCYGAHQ